MGKITACRTSRVSRIGTVDRKSRQRKSPANGNNQCKPSRRSMIVRLTMIGAVALFAFGPYDIKLLNTPKAPEAKGTARLVFAESPFVVSVTEDGRSSYDVQLNLTGLPQPSTIGAYKAYIAWAATTDL